MSAVGRTGGSLPHPSFVVEQRTKWGESVETPFTTHRLLPISEVRFFSRPFSRVLASAATVSNPPNTTMSAVLGRNCQQNGGHGGVFENWRDGGRLWVTRFGQQLRVIITSHTQ